MQYDWYHWENIAMPWLLLPLNTSINRCRMIFYRLKNNATILDDFFPFLYQLSSYHDTIGIIRNVLSCRDFLLIGYYCVLVLWLTSENYCDYNRFGIKQQQMCCDFLSIYCSDDCCIVIPVVSLEPHCDHTVLGFTSTIAIYMPH